MKKKINLVMILFVFLIVISIVLGIYIEKLDSPKKENIVMLPNYMNANTIEEDEDESLDIEFASPEVIEEETEVPPRTSVNIDFFRYLVPLGLIIVIAILSEIDDVIVAKDRIMNDK